ncbi:MAG: hypothetical protein WD069_05010 [Planctomycetales bacterium]
MGHSASAGRYVVLSTQYSVLGIQHDFRGSVRRIALALVVLLAAPLAASAQLPQLRLNSIFPTGGQIGATFEVKVASGEELEEIDRLLFDHDGIQAVPKTTEANGRQQPVDRTFLVTIGKDVPPGLYEVRVGGLFGASNPRTFVVGRRKELLETEPNDLRDQAMEVPLGAVVNGGMKGATDVDFFRFQGKKGQRVLAEVRAYRIDSRMDAALSLYDAEGRRLAYGRNTVRRDPLVDVTLPADGEYFVKLHDFTYQGGEDFFYRLAIHDGPHIDYVVPVAGEPKSQGRFTLYGRNLPGGTPSGIELHGAKLDKLEIDVALPEERAALLSAENLEPFEAGMDAVAYTVESPQGESNPVMIYLAEAPVILEQEPNDDPANPQQLSPPCEFVGQFQKVRDLDYVAFDAKKGDVYIVEVYGHRLGTSADPYFVLDRVEKNDKGEEQATRVTAQDDVRVNPDQNDPYPVSNTFDVANDDPVFRFEAPADGTYRIELRDRYFETRGDPSLAYRLVIRRESPDFRLVVVPAAITAQRNQPTQPRPLALRKGDNVALLVLAIRRDGFKGPIEVSADGLPPGVTCAPTAVGEGSSGTEIVFSATPDAADWFGRLPVRGKARIGDPEQDRAAIAAGEALKKASEPLANLQQAAQKAEDVLKQAQQKLEQAEKAAAADKEDENLAKQVAAAKQEVARQEAEATKALAARDAAQNRIDEARSALARAESERDAAVREVVREARAGTVLWKGRNNNEPSTLRLARSIALSVIGEQAPFQLAGEVTRVEVNQGRQVVLPLEVVRHEKFDDALAYTFAGLPRNANIQAANGAIPKGRDAEIARLFVAQNTPPGTYTVYLNATGKFNYVRNPARVERAKADQAEVAKLVADKQQSANEANASRDAAAQEANKAAEAVKQAQAAKTQLDQKVQQAQAAQKTAETEKQQADQQRAAAEQASKDAAGKAAEAKSALDSASDEQKDERAKSLAAAEQAAQQAQAALDQAKPAQDAAAKKFDDAKAAAETAATELAATVKSLEEAQAAAKAMAEAKQQAEAAAAAAAEALKAVQALKQKADGEFTEAQKAAQPKQITYASPSTPVVIVVREAPAKLAANVPNGGKIAPGGKLEVKVTVQREKMFAGPVTLSLPLPPGVAGLKADPVTIPADKNEGVLVVQAEESVLTAADKAAADKKVQEADAALKKSAEEKTAAESAGVKARAAVEQAAAKVNAAQAAATAAPDDKAKQDALPAVQKEAESAAAQAKEADTALAAAEKKLTDSQAALAEARSGAQAVDLALSGHDQRMVVRAEMDFEGKAAIDAPIKLNVSK